MATLFTAHWLTQVVGGSGLPHETRLSICRQSPCGPLRTRDRTGHIPGELHLAPDGAVVFDDPTQNADEDDRRTRSVFRFRSDLGRISKRGGGQVARRELRQ